MTVTRQLSSFEYANEKAKRDDRKLYTNKLYFRQISLALADLNILEQFSVGRLESGIDLAVDPPFGSNKVRLRPVRYEPNLLDG